MLRKKRKCWEYLCSYVIQEGRRGPNVLRDAYRNFLASGNNGVCVRLEKWYERKGKKVYLCIAEGGGNRGSWEGGKAEVNGCVEKGKERAREQSREGKNGRKKLEMRGGKEKEGKRKDRRVKCVGM